MIGMIIGKEKRTTIISYLKSFVVVVVVDFLITLPEYLIIEEDSELAWKREIESVNRNTKKVTFFFYFQFFSFMIWSVFTHEKICFLLINSSLQRQLAMTN